MHERTAFRLRIVAGVTVAAGAIGAFYAAQTLPTRVSIATGATVGALNGAVITALEIVLQSHAAAAMRRLPVAATLLLRTLLYGVVFQATAAASLALIRWVAPVSTSGEAAYRPSLFFLIAVSLGFNFIFMLRGLLGGRTLVALVTGRYHRPRHEERVVLFLDLQDSTRLAERLGDEAFHRFLNRVFSDITDPVLDSGGEIYRYVGDEIIVTWPITAGRSAGEPVAGLFAIGDALAGARGDFRRLFDAEPHLRGALHAGPLVVGEMGDIKREIVMLGDTMNTAARIEDQCRATGNAYIASGAALKAAGALPPGVRTQALGAMALRGKADEVALFALTRD